jgi:hypothetical protein
VAFGDGVNASVGFVGDNAIDVRTAPPPPPITPFLPPQPQSMARRMPTVVHNMKCLGIKAPEIWA